MKPKVSIIIPVYNGSRFISRLLHSIQSLSFKDYEVIIVNDGSTDDTSEKLKKSLHNKNKYTVINQINQGVAEARNMGIAHARGEWLFFLDADDRITAEYFDFLELSYNREKLDGASLILIDGVYDDYGTKKKKWGNIKHKYINKDNVIFSLNTKNMRYVWGKLYKRDFLLTSGIKFEHHKIAEDFLFNIHVCMSDAKIVIINSGFYCYYQNDFSATKTYTTQSFISRLDVILEIERLLHSTNGDDDKIKRLYMEFFLYQTLKHINKFNDEGANYLLSKIKDHNNYFSFLQIPFLPLKLKGKINFVALFLKYKVLK